MSKLSKSLDILMRQKPHKTNSLTGERLVLEESQKMIHIFAYSIGFIQGVVEELSTLPRNEWIIAAIGIAVCACVGLWISYHVM